MRSSLTPVRSLNASVIIDKKKKFFKKNVEPIVIESRLKSTSKSWRLPHNKYNYPHIPEKSNHLIKIIRTDRS